MITKTISVTELVWTMVCLVGLLFNMRILADAVDELWFIRKNNIDGIREFAAKLTMFTYLSWTIVQLIMVLVGVLSMTAKPANNSHPVSSLQIFVTIAFVLISVFLCVTAVVIERGRSSLQRRLQQQRMQEPHG